MMATLINYYNCVLYCHSLSVHTAVSTHGYQQQELHSLTDILINKLQRIRLNRHFIFTSLFTLTSCIFVERPFDHIVSHRFRSTQKQQWWMVDVISSKLNVFLFNWRKYANARVIIAASQLHQSYRPSTPFLQLFFFSLAQEDDISALNLNWRRQLWMSTTSDLFHITEKLERRAAVQRFGVSRVSTE